MSIYTAIEKIESIMNEKDLLEIKTQRNKDVSSLGRLWVFGILTPMILLILIALLTAKMQDSLKTNLSNGLVVLTVILAIIILSSIVFWLIKTIKINNKFQNDRDSYLSRRLDEENVNQSDRTEAIEFLEKMELLRYLSS